MQTFTPKQLRSALADDRLSGVTVTAQGNRFYVQVQTPTGAGVLTKARGKEPRRFRNPVQALGALWRMGVTMGNFDLAEWTPEQRELLHGRPDRSDALKRVHAAAVHDRWFRAQVEQALVEADDPATEWVSQPDAEGDMERQRAELDARIAAAK